MPYPWDAYRQPTTGARRAIRKTNLREHDGLGKTQRDELIKKGLYPPGIKLSESGRALIWFDDIVAAYQRWREAEARDAEVRKALAARRAQRGT
jgi:hypothetical protein